MQHAFTYMHMYIIYYSKGGITFKVKEQEQLTGKREEGEQVQRIHRVRRRRGVWTTLDALQETFVPSCVCQCGCVCMPLLGMMLLRISILITLSLAFC